ncbi:hypothetical protein FSP39_014282 [Pinctada imbricata]|uniref:Methyltransferase domain-containing protein n=1 Tax=Pinctada imbricata TaxID=66713 RepID=A0AA88YNQ0_PINIB|nr:hypothetical protein FSP39_014282 [Pinctada imbricata]
MESLKIGPANRHTDGVRGCKFFSGAHGPVKPNNANSLNLFLMDCPICFSETFDIAIPNDDSLKQMSLNALSCLYQRYVTSLQSLCKSQRRYGNVNYGGFEMCMDQNEAQKNGCLIYIFNHDMSELFDKQMETTLNCAIRKSNTDITFSEKYLNGEMVILNIESKHFSTLETFVDMLKSSRVQQIVLEIHFDSNVESKSNHEKILSILRKLYAIQYRIYWFDRNFAFVKNGRSTCFTINFHLIEDVASHSLNSEISFEEVRFAEVLLNNAPSHQILCKQMLRLGAITDGGWDVCHDELYRIRSPCIVYSFGINNDFSFDDDVERTFGCDVFAFDPSMSAKTHRRSKNVMFYAIGIGNENKNITVGAGNWEIKTLDTIRRELGHTNRQIDILKMDIESNEKQSLPQMIKSGVLNKVRQLCIEFHDYHDVGTFLELYNIGFRIFWTHLNPATPYYVNNRSYSHGWEIYFVNINLKRT